MWEDVPITAVMAGLVPAIHVGVSGAMIEVFKDVDTRNKCEHDASV
jgi:hypothetical protein